MHLIAAANELFARFWLVVIVVFRVANRLSPPFPLLLALQEYQRIEAETARLRSLAAKEKQVAQRVTMNIELQRLQHELEAMNQQLIAPL